MSFRDALADLERRGVMPLRAPTLDNTRLALGRFRLSWPGDLKKVISVAGTNGKGSTAKTLETLLRSAGQRTGLYTSPHLEHYCERIMIDGEPVHEDLFEDAWRVVRDKTIDLPLSHFEVLTVMAAWLFFSGEAVRPVDQAIFEVGLGGLWDATNAVPHKTAVICRLGLDHQEILGQTIIEIAKNKFGVISKQSSVIHLPLPREVEELKEETMLQTQSQWISAGRFGIDYHLEVDQSQRLPVFFLLNQWGRSRLSLPGRRGAENAQLACKAFASLGFAPAPHLGALSEVKWAARMQELPLKGARCPVFLSGDHNPQGIESLLELLPYYRGSDSRSELRLVIGVGIKKDLSSMLQKLTGLPRVRFWLTRAEFQGRQKEDYGEWLSRSEGFFENPVDALLAAVKTASPDDFCLITGSLYLSGDLLRGLKTADCLDLRPV